MPARTLFAAVLFVLCSFSAWGTMQRTFVASSGSDMNSCGRTDPCRSFAAAIIQTDANGEVVAIDSAGYGPVTIAQNVAVVAPIGVYAGISVFTGDGITISGATTVAILRNLYVNGQGGNYGITVNAAHVVHIEHCVVNGFTSNNINLASLYSGRVAISDTVSRHSGQSGIYVATQATVTIDRCRVESNAYGIVADRGSVAISNSVADGNDNQGFYARMFALMGLEGCVTSHNTAGVQVDSGCAAIVHNTMALDNPAGYSAGTGTLSLDHCVASGGIIGVDVEGGDATVSNCMLTGISSEGVRVGSGVARLSGNTITRTTTGINNLGGTVHSTGDNMIDGNGTNISGATTPANKG